jgi:uncharacterized protein YeaO (DUF488 family)
MAKTKTKCDIARVYDAAAPDGRFRVLVDRLWPRGVKKEDLKLDAWMKELAPSAELRRWFNHDPQRWEEFRKRFFKELNARPDVLARLRDAAETQSVLLLYGARDEKHNNAVALKEFLETNTAEHKASTTRRHSQGDLA